MKKITLLLGGAVFALLTAFPSGTARAAAISEDLPNLSTQFGSYRAAHLSDGRLVYGTNDDLDRQSSFTGAFTLQDYAANIAPNTFDPSAIAIYSDTLGAIGTGFSGNTRIYLFDPSNLATAFTAIPNAALQNYSVVFRDANSLFVGGQNGTGGLHSVSYLTTDGSVSKVIIDSISTFSGDFASDLAGNLYVSDNDDLKLYKFTPQQLTSAINGAALQITDGQLVTTLNKNGSLAVDGFGRILSAGYQSDGFDLFDPANGSTTSFVPEFANSNYVVSTFTVAGESYISYVNAAGFNAGDAVKYGYERAADLVPEPAGALFALGAAALCLRRSRRV